MKSLPARRLFLFLLIATLSGCWGSESSHCVLDSDCASDQYCDTSNNCTDMECDDHADCFSGEICTEDYKCETIECDSDLDCPSDTGCEDGACAD